LCWLEEAFLTYVRGESALIEDGKIRRIETYLSDVDGMDAFFPIRLPKPDIGVLTGNVSPWHLLTRILFPAHIDSYPDRGAVYL
jgi:hypothetical protein